MSYGSHVIWIPCHMDPMSYGSHAMEYQSIATVYRIGELGIFLWYVLGYGTMALPYDTMALPYDTMVYN